MALADDIPLTGFLRSNRFLVVLIIAVALGWAGFALLGASAGLFSIDELIYQGMIDAFSRDHSLAIGNGYAEYPSESLKLIMLVESSGRLVPQYPSGWAILASPVYDVAGLRGVLMINAVAAVLTLALVWVAGRTLLDDARLASVVTLLYALATFAVDYAFAIWPHAVSTCLVTAAFAAVAVGWRSEGRHELVTSLGAGVAIGIAVNIRSDAVLAVPALALWLLGTYRRPFPALALLVAGGAPGIVSAAVLNAEKFGIFGPVTYGRQGSAAGATSVDYYAPMLVPAALLAVGALSLSVERVRRLLFRPLSIVLAPLLVLVAAVVSPAFGALVQRVGVGLYVLIVDLQASTDTNRPEVHLLADGTFRFWGLAKKSLLESAPYLAGTVILLRGLISANRNAAPLWFCVLFCAVWAVPFAYGQFHGGLSNNMRYFGPLLPAACILAVAAWRELPPATVNWRVSLALALVVVIGVAISPHLAGYPPYFIWENVVPLRLAAVLAVLSLLLLPEWIRSRSSLPIAGAWRGVFLAGVVMASISAYYFDLSVSQTRRDTHQLNAERYAGLPANSLVVTFGPEAAGFRLNDPRRMTSQANWRKGTFDAGLVHYAFRSGRRVFVQGSYLATAMQRSGLAHEAVPWPGNGQATDLYELRLPSGQADGE